jgi:transposase/uncharacterized protein (DUF1330 family)
MKKETERRGRGAVKLYEAGMGAPEIGRKLGIGTTSVYRVLTKAGISPRSLIASRQRNRIGLFTPEQDREIAALYREKKMSLTQLAAKYNCCVAAIRNSLRREKVVLNRPGREAKKKEKVVAPTGKPWSRTRPKNYGHGSITDKGYRVVRVDVDDPMRRMAQVNGYIAEHRLIMARYLGRSLRPNETVHHINGNRTDNRVANLQLLSGKHCMGTIPVCAKCGSHDIIYEEINGNGIEG